VLEILSTNIKIRLFGRKIQKVKTLYKICKLSAKAGLSGEVRVLITKLVQNTHTQTNKRMYI